MNTVEWGGTSKERFTKRKGSWKYEVKEKLEAQRVIDEILVTNCDAIKRIDILENNKK